MSVWTDFFVENEDNLMAWECCMMLRQEWASWITYVAANLCYIKLAM